MEYPKDTEAAGRVVASQSAEGSTLLRKSLQQLPLKPPLLPPSAERVPQTPRRVANHCRIGQDL